MQNNETAATPEVLNTVEFRCENLTANYEYESPTKMSSPQKKAFSKKLFAHDDKINLKVQKSLMAAKNVKESSEVTIVDSR